MLNNYMSQILGKVKIGIVALNWKFEMAKSSDFLERVAAYGFKGIQISVEQANSDSFLAQMKKKNLATAEQYLDIACDENGPLSTSDAHSNEIVDAAIRADVQMLVFAVDGTLERDIHAGRSHVGPHLNEAGYQRLAEHISKYALLAKASGVRSSFHPHAATYVETPEETRKLMALIDHDLVGLCLDVGHWMVGGGDPIQGVTEYGKRVTHVHIKDVDPEVLKKLIAGEYEGMHVAVEDHFLFVPAGEGALDLSGLCAELGRIGFSDWMMSEQDKAREPAEEKSGISIRNIKAALKASS
jgi:inosose dehydratase